MPRCTCAACPQVAQLVEAGLKQQSSALMCAALHLAEQVAPSPARYAALLEEALFQPHIAGDAAGGVGGVGGGQGGSRPAAA
jgi:hypothetical protein